MKTLSVRQPWASLICYGIKDVENRSWRTKPRRILIHASGKKIPNDFDSKCLSSEQISYLSHIKQSNLLPKYEDMPLSSIIGYVEIMDITLNSESVWAVEGQKHWLLENAYLLDKPITNVKGKLGLFEFPLDEMSLPPSHKVNILLPTVQR